MALPIKRRASARSMRELERERTNLQNQEKKMINEIKDAAKKGQVRPEEPRKNIGCARLDPDCLEQMLSR